MSSESLLDFLRSRLECPVCLEVRRDDGVHIFHCRNGHLVCQECYAGLRTCPACRVALPATGKLRSAF